MGRAFEYRKAAKLKRWGHMAKTFTRLGKQIAIAVKAGGPEPENNPTLRSVIATCKRENMPKDNIERAIKNALGKDQSDYKGMTYEGYGPHGIAVFVDTLTDNTTRTVADVRSVFNKFGGNLGTMGSLAFLFDHKCMFTFKIKEGMDMYPLRAFSMNPGIARRDLMGKDPLINLPFNQYNRDPEYRAFWQKKNGIWELANGITFGLSNVLIVFPEARTARTVVLVIMVIVDVIYVVAYESWEHSND